MVSSASSCPNECPAAAACSAANSGHNTMSPSIEGPGSGASGGPPGSSSSIGKLIPSVGPGRSIQRMCRSAIAAVSNSTIDSSALGLTSILAITNRATLTNSASETSMPDSLDTSMLISSSRSSSAAAGTRGPPGRPGHPRAGVLVAGGGVDDLRDQPVAHDIHARQLRDVDVLDALEDVDRGPQPGTGAARKVDLGHVPGDDDLRPEAQSGEEHLHLLGGGVLRLVEDDEGVIKGASAHVPERRDLNYPGRHQLWDQLGVHHVVERVIQWPQVRVDLLAQRSRQKTKALTGFHGRTGEDDPADLLGLQRVHGLRHGQIGLPGAGGADPEDDRVGVDGVDVALLVERLGPDRVAAARQDVEGEHLGR